MKVAIVGAGGFGRETLDVFRAFNSKLSICHSELDVLGFIDDNKELHGTTLHGISILGGLDYFKTHKNVKCIVGIGDTKIREAIVKKLEMWNTKFCSIIHPNTVIADAKIGEGSIICAGNILTNNITVGNHVIINLDCTIGHDTIIEDFATISPGVHINGRNIIRKGVYLGSGATTIQGIEIGQNTVIGAQACIIRNIPPNVKAIGVPAKVIEK